MSISDLRYLSFEVAPKCNLAHSHSFCPVNDQFRYPKHEPKDRCPDNIIVAFAKAVHARGFTGLVGFHYYCDPLVDVPRMLLLMSAVKVVAPYAKFVLWTNGTLLKQHHRNWLEAFEKVIITRHSPKLDVTIQDVIHGLPNVQVCDAYYDDRTKLYSQSTRTMSPCIRPACIELPVNYYGSVRLCCADYRGNVSLGNIAIEDHGKILDGFEEAGRMAMESRIPICHKCCSLSSSPRALV